MSEYSLRRTDTRIAPAAEASISGRGQRFLDYWHAKAPERGYPRRSDIRPDEILPLLPYIFMVDVLRGEAGLDFRFRLIGTAIAGIEGELTGQLLSEMFPDRERYATLWQQYLDAVSGKVGVRHETLRWQDRDHVSDPAP